jgi:hypothetical protein
MKKLFAIIAAVSLALPAIAQSKTDQDKKADQAQIVSTAEIVKIDAKKKSLQVRDLAEPVTTNPNGTGSRRTGGGGGGYPGGGGGYPGGGGRRRGGGVGFPGGGGRYPGGGGGGGGSRGSSTPQAKEYKVFVGKDTIMKLANTDIGFTDFHVGDRITISGTPKGSKGDIDALTITRSFQ